MNINRRKFLEWTTPVVVAVALPAHAQTSMEPPIPDPEPPMPDPEPPTPDPEPPMPDPEPPIPEFSDPEDCTVPTIPPRPGFGRGACGGRSLKAAALDRRAFSFFNSTRPTRPGFPTNKDKACTAIRNYKFCGFPEDPTTRLCNDLARQIRKNGDFAVNILGPMCE